MFIALYTVLLAFLKIWDRNLGKTLGQTDKQTDGQTIPDIELLCNKKGWHLRRIMKKFHFYFGKVLFMHSEVNFIL